MGARRGPSVNIKVLLHCTGVVQLSWALINKLKFGQHNHWKSDCRQISSGIVWRYLPEYQVSKQKTYSLHRWFQSSITYEWLRFCARKIEWKKCKISRCENCRWSSQIDYSWKGNTYKVHGIQRSTFYIPSTIKTQMDIVLQMLFGRLGKMNAIVSCTLECPH